MMRRRINTRFCVIVLVSLILLGVGTHFLHSFQVKRNASTFLAMADLAKSENRLRDSAVALERYISLGGADPEAHAKLGLLLIDLMAGMPRGQQAAFEHLEAALRMGAEKPEMLRRSLVKLALQFERVKEAKYYLDTLTQDKEAPGQSELLYWEAGYQELIKDYKEAANRYGKVIEYARSHKMAKPEEHVFASYLKRAIILRRTLQRNGEEVPASKSKENAPAVQGAKGLRADEEAMAVMHSLVRDYPALAEAFITHAQYLRTFGDPRQKSKAESLSKAAQDVEQALKLKSDDAKVGAALLVFAGDLAIERKQFDEGRAYLTQLLDNAPGRLTAKDARDYQSRAYQGLARLEVLAGKRKEAMDYLEKGLKVLPNHPESLRAVVGVLIEMGDEKSLEQAEKKLKELDRILPDEQVKLLAAQLDVRKERWLSASTTLEVIRPLVKGSVQTVLQIDLLLGTCYERLGELEREQAAYRHALQLDPFWLPARQRLARSLVNMGRVDEAMEEYRKLVEWDKDARDQLAVLTVGRQLRPNLTNDGYVQLNTILKKLEELQGPEEVGSAILPILRAEVSVAKKDYAGARKELETALKKVPEKQREDRMLLRIELADVTERDFAEPELKKTQAEKALRILEETRKELGDSIELRLALGRYWLRQQPEEASKKLVELEADRNKLDGDETRLLRGLADLQARLGNTKDTLRLWTEIAAKRENELRAQLILFDLTYQTGNKNALAEVLEKIKKIEGEGTFWNSGKASLLLLAARKGGPDAPTALSEARKHLSRVSRNRPGWPELLRRIAEVDELEGKVDAATKNYRLAMDGGDRSPQTIRSLVNLLYKQRRYAEADEMLHKLEEKAPLPGNLTMLAANLSLHNRDEARALQLADRVAEQSLRTPGDCMWLGQIRWALSENQNQKADQRKRLRDGAEEAFQQAVKLAEKAPEAWAALVLFYARTGQKEQAEAEIKKAQTKLPAEILPFIIGPCYEALGLKEKAEEQFRQAVTSGGAHVATGLRAGADFYLRQGEFAAAEPLLRQLLDQPKATAGDKFWSRRNLALGRARGLNYKDYQEALGLIQMNLDEQGKDRPGLEDLRAKATVLALRPFKYAEAIELYKDLKQRQPLSPQEQWTLIKLYAARGEAAQARVEMLILLTSAEAQQSSQYPDYVVNHIQDLVDRGEIPDARFWLARLEKREIKPLPLLKLNVLVLEAERRTKEAIGQVKKYAETEKADLREAAQLLEKLRQVEDAEKLYRRHAADPKHPKGNLLLAYFLSRRNRVDEALTVCASCWDSRNPDAVAPDAVAMASVLILRKGRAGNEVCRRVEAQFQTAIQQAEKPVGVLLSLADLYDYQNRHAEAEKCYYQILKHDPMNIGALNNLAWLLGQSRNPEALSLINRAIDQYGPVGELLDTRAVIYLQSERPEQAIKDLRDAIDQKPAAARFFHLAQAYQRTRRPAETREYFRRVREFDANLQTLHPNDRIAYKTMGQVLGID